MHAVSLEIELTTPLCWQQGSMPAINASCTLQGRWKMAGVCQIMISVISPPFTSAEG